MPVGGFSRSIHTRNSIFATDFLVTPHNQVDCNMRHKQIRVGFPKEALSNLSNPVFYPTTMKLFIKVNAKIDILLKRMSLIQKNCIYICFLRECVNYFLTFWWSEMVMSRFLLTINGLFFHHSESLQASLKLDIRASQSKSRPFHVE